MAVLQIEDTNASVESVLRGARPYLKKIVLSTSVDIMTEEDLTIAMQKFFPKGCAYEIAHIVFCYDIVFKVVRPRRRYLGTCSKYEKTITVNGNLPPYLFLLVTLHELGHFLAIKKYGTNIKPHGQEWKEEYTKLLKHFLYKGVFPVKLAEKVMQEIIAPKATCSIELKKACADFL